MGAAVTKLEDPQRLDIYRRRGPFADGVPGLNRSAYFNQLNFCKTTLDVNVGDDGAEIDLGAYDVVLHNLMPRRAKVVGVNVERVLTATADHSSPTLSISSSGFGGTGEWAAYRAYGHNIHAFAGLIGATRDARGEMGDMGTPWADPLSSVAIAAWVLAWSLATERSSVGIDISMAELTAAQIADLHGVDPADVYRAPQVGGDFFLRATNGSALLAVSLHTVDEVSRFEELVGHRLPPMTTLGQLVEFDLDGIDLSELDSRFRVAGLATSLVYTAHDLAQDDFVRTTGIFQRVHSGDLGDYEITGLPWHFTGQPRVRVQAAPERPSE
jgi:crotonobetainyl-CoA:carnitine CoA-transferase CaiB-like acyl-CoA transferase